MGKGIVDPSAVTLRVIMAGLSGAIAWNLTSWRLGLPTSSSHALIGGVAGAAIAASGLGTVKWDGLKDKVLVPSLVAPIAGVLIAGLLAFALLRVARRRNPERVAQVARRGQLLSAARCWCRSSACRPGTLLVAGLTALMGLAAWRTRERAPKAPRAAPAAPARP